jgi:RS4NT (NUC023) domain
MTSGSGDALSQSAKTPVPRPATDESLWTAYILSFLTVRVCCDQGTMPRGPKKHLKRLNAPKHWMLDKLGGVFVRYHSYNVVVGGLGAPHAGSR